jgi:hypothetical protein
VRKLILVMAVLIPAMAMAQKTKPWADKPGSSIQVKTTVTQSVAVHWTAPGNSGYVGKAAEYDGRYCVGDSMQLHNNWANCPVIPNMPLPEIAGTPQTVTVEGLQINQSYAFGIKTRGQPYEGNPTGLWSEISNTPTIVPIGPPGRIIDVQIGFYPTK